MLLHKIEIELSKYNSISVLKKLENKVPSVGIYNCVHLKLKTVPFLYSSELHNCHQLFSPMFYSDMKKVGVTVVGPQKKIISSIKALETQSKNGPVPV